MIVCLSFGGTICVEYFGNIFRFGSLAFVWTVKSKELPDNLPSQLGDC